MDKDRDLQEIGKKPEERDLLASLQGSSVFSISCLLGDSSWNDFGKEVLLELLGLDDQEGLVFIIPMVSYSGVVKA